MHKQLEDLHINQTKIAKAIKKISSKPKSSCCKTKSKSRTKKKKSSKCVNVHIISDKSYRKDNYSSNIGITKTEIENLIKSMMPSQLISSQLYQSYRPQPPGTSQIICDKNINKFIQWISREVTEFVPVPSLIYLQNR